jgi:hypothetical protein
MSAILLVAGALLLVTWLVSPAASAPPQQPTPRATPLDAVMPLLGDVNTQTDRLRDRVDDHTPYPAPTRNPFDYVRPASSRAASANAAAVDAAMPASAPDPTPRLVAIIADEASDAPTRRAVFSNRDEDVQFAVVGDTVGRFVVSDIQSDVVVLSDTVSGDSIRLPLN